MTILMTYLQMHRNEYAIELRSFIYSGRIRRARQFEFLYGYRFIVVITDKMCHFKYFHTIPSYQELKTAAFNRMNQAQASL